MSQREQPGAAMQAAGRGVAWKLAQDVLARLGEISRSLSQMLALQQSPRKNLLAAGSLPGGGTVGTTPQSCTVQVAGSPPGTLLNPNPHRRGCSIQNTGAAGNLTIGLGITQPTSGQGLILAPGATWDGRISGESWLGSVAVIGSQAGVTFAFVEVNGPSGRVPPNEAL